MARVDDGLIKTVLVTLINSAAAESAEEEVITARNRTEDTATYGIKLPKPNLLVMQASYFPSPKMLNETMNNRYCCV